MNIALLCNSLGWGGLEINLCKLAVWLQETGNNVLLICPANSRVDNGCKELGITAQHLHTRFKYADATAAVRLKTILKKHQSKALIIGCSKDIHFSILAKLLPGYRFKAMYLDSMAIGVNKKDLIHTFIYNRLDKWITPLNSLKETILKRTRIKEDKVIVITNSIELDRFQNINETKESIRADLNIPKDVFLIGLIGRFEPGKGQHLLIEALRILKEKGIEVHALLAGEITHYTPDILKNVKDYGLEQQVHLKGFIKEVQYLYKALDLYAMASCAETFGMVTIEAMAAGIPIIGAKAGGTASLIQENSTGLFFQNENVEDLADKIVTLKENPELAKKLAAAAQAYVKENNSHKVMCERIISLI